MTIGKTVLITGANKGIGYETARQLGGMGFTILIGSRNEQSGREAVAKLANEGVEARLILLDVTSQSTIDSAVHQIKQESGSLDVLINNAGISLGGATPPSQFSLGDLRETYETNFFGLVAVTQAMLPLLQESPCGRIVNLSSGLGSLTYNSDPEHEHAQFNLLAYNSSKAAVNMFTVTLAKELKDSPLKVNSADPGFTATDLNGFTGPGSVQQAAAVVVRLATLNNDGPSGGFFDSNGEVPW
ncbi:NAD(P)-dependent dehydrogenase (short-subunit alcohol dehydrogenase family) [Paenibacillus polymyxa]|uniref:SDR family oxidoreductase n=1 Tax=Paenibacillus polymyxa TaxID=1406 RepID=UPI0027924C6C|nr:SDR family oxidoreductase [Paenibacillus polymyxa]MDQ0048502.1 NAD(P)-dependent dehydrogenase (short-subunit alcohol dehydrogenase family) [Paenibacillus polymyxa]